MDLRMRAEAKSHQRTTLAHETRRRIYEHLLGYSGASRRDIAEALHIAAPTLRHHLDVMTARRLLLVHKAGRELLYTCGSRVDAIASLRNPRRHHMAGLLLEAPRSQKELADATGLSQRLVAYHLARMEDVVVGTHQRPRRYRVLEPMRVRAALTDPPR